MARRRQLCRSLAHTTILIKMKRVVFVFLLAFALSCAATKPISNLAESFWNLSPLSAEELKMANELLAYGLEHEALYTLLDTLKPISSLGFSLSYPLAKDSLMKDGNKSVVQVEIDSIDRALSEIEQWNNITSALSNEHLTFLLIPYKRPWNGDRNLQLLVVKNDVFSNLLNRKAEFFGQWGFTKNADPSTVLTTIEFESRHDRFRAYGYLFGYPEHAVDFFVEASISEEETGEFVTRDFFSMPVAVGTTGYFTYAIPKGYLTDQSDSSIYHAATSKLERYMKIKADYIDSAGNLDAVRLLSDYWKSNTSNQ